MHQKVKRYVEMFSQDQVLITIFDDLVKNPKQELCRLYRFLGVTEVNYTLLKKRNTGGVPRLSLLKSRKLVGFAKKLIPSSKHTQIDNLIKRMFFKKTSLSSAQKEELKLFFHEDVKQLSRLIGRDLNQEWQLSGLPNTRTDTILSTDNKGYNVCQTRVLGTI